MRKEALRAQEKRPRKFLAQMRARDFFLKQRFQKKYYLMFRPWKVNTFLCHGQFSIQTVLSFYCENAHSKLR